MALTATLHRFELELADIDRGVYATLEHRVACHPSEDHARMVLRVLARALLHEEGLDFGRGLSHPDEPALKTTSPTGTLTTWIDVGAPSAERLHRANKKADRVVVVTTKKSSSLKREWTRREIHRADEIDLLPLDSIAVDQLAEKISRAMKWFVTIHEGTLSVNDGEDTIELPLVWTNVARFLETAS